MKQAAAAAELLCDTAIHYAFSSPLVRAFATAEIIAEPHGCRVETVADLRECDVGRWEGLSWEEIAQRDPEACERFLRDPGVTSYPEGESFGDVERRVLPAVNCLLEKHTDGNILIVWHAAVGQVYLGHLLGLPHRRARELHVDNGGVSVVRLVGDAPPKLHTLNSAFHLP